jgi:hypothetical protein
MKFVSVKPSEYEIVVECSDKEKLKLDTNCRKDGWICNWYGNRAQMFVDGTSQSEAIREAKNRFY